MPNDCKKQPTDEFLRRYVILGSQHSILVDEEQNVAVIEKSIAAWASAIVRAGGDHRLFLPIPR